MSPMVFYEDVSAALEFLEKAFGFEKKMSLPGPDGGIVHAEMTSQDAVIMLGPTDADRGLQSPKTLGAVNQSIYCYVDDVDAHFERAAASGANVVSEPETMFWGDRMYYVQDCEGHHWNFAQRVHDPDPSELPGAS